MKHETAARIYGTPPQHQQGTRLRRQTNRLIWADHFKLHQKLRKIDPFRRTIDDDPHRALLGMGANVNDRAGKAIIEHPWHRNKQLPIEIAALALPRGRWRNYRSHVIRPRSQTNLRQSRLRLSRRRNKLTDTSAK